MYIQLVESDKTTAEVLRIYLVDYCQHEVEVTETLNGSLLKLRARRPDLLLCNLTLDDKTCIPLIEEARELYTPPPTTILMTAMTTDVEYWQKYCDTLLLKPFDLEELDELLKNLMFP